ncbi:MAG: hypothetical protein HY552_05660 [Elusimicrobia bacterium]|nr:hypothetical protein [Elusimicrobiota bacterium]
MDLLRPRFKPRRPAAGSALVEVVVAILVLAVIAAAVFSVALTSKAGGGKSGRRLLALMATKQVTGQLRGYVTGCYDYATASFSSCGGVSGPNACAGANSWSMTNPCATANSPSGIIDTGPASSAYAFSLGTHILTGVLPAWLEAAPYNGRVRYVVTAGSTISNCGYAGHTCVSPAVSVTADWTEP